LEHIGSGAFKGCDSLQNVYIPESVTTMGSGAFERFSITLRPGGWRPPTLKEDSSTSGNDSQESSMYEGSSEESSFDESASATDKGSIGILVPSFERLVIYVYVPVKPKGWADDWYKGNPKIVWDYLELSDEDEKLSSSGSFDDFSGSYNSDASESSESGL
jgi:hypothetical protein